MEIGKRKIGLKHKPFIIGEISGNHKGSISRALKIIKNIKTAGGSACKLQTFDLDEMTLPLKNKIFTVNDKKVPGIIEVYTNSTKKPTHLFPGMKEFLNILKK